MSKNTYTIALLASFPFFAIVNGFTMKMLWLWFVVPAFGAPPLAIPQAYGLTILAMMLVSQQMTPLSPDENLSDRFRRLLWAVLGRNFIALTLGYGTQVFL